MREVEIEVDRDTLLIERGEMNEEEEMAEMFEGNEEIIEKTLKKAKRLIEGVKIIPELVCNEECDTCHHQKPKLIKMVALIGLKAKNGVVVDAWSYQYCLECLSKLAEAPVKVADGSKHSTMYV